MKNIHVLPTDKPSRLFYNVGVALLFTNYENHNGVNIYITSNDPAYPYAFHITNQEVLKVRAVGYKSLELYHDKGFSFPEQCRKIILTTDQDLIKDGVQAIDDEFLEWFVKNPSCEEVEVKKEYITPLGDIVETCYDNERLNYKIIIPKEEAKQDEIDFMANELVIEKERMYSEEDLIDAFNEGQSLNIRGNYFPSREKDIWYSVFELNSCISLQNTFTTKKLLEIFKKIKK